MAFGKAFKDLERRANTTITAVIQSGSNTIRSLNDQIDNWSVRLDAGRPRYSDSTPI